MSEMDGKYLVIGYDGMGRSMGDEDIYYDTREEVLEALKQLTDAEPEESISVFVRGTETDAKALLEIIRGIGYTPQSDVEPEDGDWRLNFEPKGAK